MNSLLRFVILLISVSISMVSYAQKKTLTLDLVTKGYQLYPSIEMNTLGWHPTLPQYLLEKNGDIYLVDPKNLKEKLFLSLADIKASNPEAEELKTLASLSFRDPQTLQFSSKGKYYEYSLDSKKFSKFQEIDKTYENTDIASNGNLAFTKEHNLYIKLAKENTEIALSTDGSEAITYGESVHRQEFGIYKGTFWSPSGDKLAFYRMDQSMVTKYPLFQNNSRPATFNEIFYPMAGDASHHVTLGVYHLTTKKTVYLNVEGPKDQYLTNVTWSPDGSLIYLAIVNRDQNESRLQSYNAETGEFIKTLFIESEEKYVEPERGPYFIKDGKEFVWFSERDGYDHLYLYSSEGKLLRQLTKGPWVVMQILGTNTKGTHLYFTANKESALGVFTYSVELSSGSLHLITPQGGTHHTQISSDGLYALDSYSHYKGPAAELQLIDVAKAKVLHTLETVSNPLDDFQHSTTEIVTLKAKDGTPLYAQIMKPFDFDPNKKYPVFYYLYGGPHVQLVTEGWNTSTSLFLNYMASKGYIVFSLDNRGSANRGKAFEQAIFRNLGTVEVEDHLQGVAYLKSLPYVDADHMAIQGWSFGGFMTTSLMLKHPDIFKVGVAGGPVIDWSYYEIMYTERYMDDPKSNPTGFENSKLTNYVDQLKGRLLLIHGWQDDVVVPQHTSMFIQKCIEKRKLVDYFFYPYHPHNVGGADRQHLYKVMEDYIERHLFDK